MLSASFNDIRIARETIRVLIRDVGLAATLHGLNDVCFGEVENGTSKDLDLYRKANKAVFSVLKSDEVKTDESI